MSFPNNQSFRQKYRVFSAAFWQNNGSTFDLEKSDKIVLPPSALVALTECNTSYPVLLKIERMDSSTNKPLPSNIFSYVIDYNAPEGLIYISSWMIEKLKLDQSGQSVVELSLPTQNNLKYQCPTADFLQLQPHSLELMLLDNITQLVHKSLSEYYSSLRINDIITIYEKNKNKIYQLTVMKISGKNTSYTPKCVKLNNNMGNDNLMLGFSEPKSYDISNDNDKNDNDNKDESDGEWEIVSVAKITNLDDLEWKDNKIDDDIKQPSNINKNIQNPSSKPQPQPQPLPQPVPVKPVKPIQPVQPQPVKPQPQPVIPQPQPQPVKPKPQPVIPVATSWDCTKCSSSNDLGYKFCPKCGSMRVIPKPKPKPQPIPQPQPQPPPQAKPKPKPIDNGKNNDNVAVATNDDLNEIVLKKVSIINDGAYDPSEHRETGWIVKNISSKILNLNAKIIKLGGGNLVKVRYDKKLKLNMKPNDERFILLSVDAPGIPSQYHQFYQIVLENDNTKRICDMLQLPILVRKQFNDTKESKIANIIQNIGFNDRKKVVQALKKWNWDECKAINWLVTH